MAGTKSLLQNQKFSQSINNQNLLCSCTETKTRWQHGIALFFSCLSHRIGLSLKWAISIRVWLLFQEIWLLSVFSWRIIVNRFYSYGRHNFTSRIQYLKACWTLCCSTSLGNVPATFYCACICCDFDPATCLHYTSLLHIISACTTHVFVAATCLCNMIPCVWPPLDFCAQKKNLYSPGTF